jgi:hypothetical protein
MTLDHLDMAIAFAVVMLVVSMLVTIFVQTVSAVAGLRGTNLRWGVEEVLRVVHPALGDHAGTIADRVLQHPIISDSAMTRFARARELPVVGRWIARLHYAKAIRVQELVGIMDVLAAGTPAPADLASATTDEQRMAYVVAAARQTFSATVGIGRIDRLAERIGAASPPKLAPDDLQSWFDATMDRVSQRFLTHVRVWTVVFSITVAFALHLDTFRLLSQLAANPDARARLAGASDALERVAGGAAASTSASSATPSPTPATSGNSAPPPPRLYQDVMKRYVRTDEATKQLDPQSVPGFFPDRVTAAEWLRGTMTALGKSPAEVEAAVASYENDVDAALGAGVGARESEVRRLSDQALTLRGVLGGTGFQLVPDPYHSWDVSPWWPTPVWAGVRFATLKNLIRNVFRVRPANLHFWGILFSAGLLSLGAPFWYNALKSLSALKPTLANKEDQERRG